MMRLGQGRALLLFLSCVGTVFGQAASAASSTLSGTVVDQAGAGVPGGTVSIVRQAKFVELSDHHRIRTDPGIFLNITCDGYGAFSASNLSAGSYHVCAHGPAGSTVGACEWMGVSTIALASGEILNNVQRVILPAALVTINISDPKSRLNGGKFRIGLADSSLYKGAVRVASGPTSQTFQLAIPQERPLRVFLDTDVAVEDSQGHLIESGKLSSMEVLAAAGVNRVTVTLTIP